MRRIKIEFAYDGRNFYGVQALKDKRTIQGTLEEALSKLLNEPIKIVTAGRTDAGVSATYQVAHFDTNSTIISTNICYAVNKLLPSDLQVLSSKNASENFHARYSAKQKTYKYFVYVSSHTNPVYDNFMYRCDKDLNLGKMIEASEHLIGKHNFKAFATKSNDTKTYDREIKSINITQNQKLFTFEITGNSFLYNMVRIIVGSLIDIGAEKYAPSHIKEILDSKDRKNAGKLVPSKALFLVNIEY